jgi:hypothetical protein
LEKRVRAPKRLLMPLALNTETLLDAKQPRTGRGLRIR